MSENEPTASPTGGGLAERLRDAVEADAADYTPGTDLLDRIETTGTRHLRAHRLRRRAGGGLAAAAAVVAVVFGVTRLVADDDPDTIDVATEGSGQTLVDPTAPPATSDVARDAEETATADEPVLLAGVDLEPELVRDERGDALYLNVPGTDVAPEAAQLRTRRYGEVQGTATTPGTTGSTRFASGIAESDGEGFFVLDGYVAELVDSDGQVVESVELPRLTLGDPAEAASVDIDGVGARLIIFEGRVIARGTAPNPGFADLPWEGATLTFYAGEELLERFALADARPWQLDVDDLYEQGDIGLLRAVIEDASGRMLYDLYPGVLLEGTEPRNADLNDVDQALRFITRSAENPEFGDAYGELARQFESRVPYLDDETARAARSQLPLVEHTPLTEYGVGPLRAGMTLAEAEAVLDVDLEISGFDDTGDLCFNAAVEGQPDLLLIVASPSRNDDDPMPVQDPRDGIIGSIVVRNPDSGRTTADLVRVGDGEASVPEAYEEELRVSGHRTLPDGQHLFYEPRSAPDHTIAYVTDGDVVDEIHVGLRDVAGRIVRCG
ncbi:MAG: hypothetical protein S0880_00330 [Actinomycetota bacterium]|nr:hypothetical protein [Actinomycetota bacterium]